MKRIGILGGTFDPVHCGHLHLAEDAMKQGRLDEVIFIPARIQPFKLGKKITSGKDRIAMLQLATERTPGFSVSSYELDADGVSYTYLTLRALQKKYGQDTRLYFISRNRCFFKDRAVDEGGRTFDKLRLYHWNETRLPRRGTGRMYRTCA